VTAEEERAFRRELMKPISHCSRI